MTRKSDAKFKEKLTCSFKHDMGNFVNFHRTTQKSKTFNFNGLFLSKVYDLWAKKYRGVIFHDNEQWYKIWINPDLAVSKMAWAIGWTFIRALKSLKNYVLMGSFCPKHLFQLENFRGIMYHDNEEWCKIQRKADLWLEKRHKEFGLFSCKQSKVWKFALWSDAFVQSLDEKVQKS